VRRALVLGLARSGRAAQAALEAGGTEVVVADRTLGNDEDLTLLDGVEVLVKSPGVPGEAPLVAAARERGIPVWSEIELASRLLPNPILGVTGTEALLILIGGIYVVEALSVIIQTVSFKYWGRRVFLIAPIHHHFEMKAWSETKIMVRFWIVAAILSACGFVLYYRYYLDFKLR